MAPGVQLANEETGLAVLVDALLVVVGTPVSKTGGGASEKVPHDDQAKIERETATRARCLPLRRARRR